MKSVFSKLLVPVILFSVKPAMATGDISLEEIYPQTVLAPSQGFDDNDNVEVVIHGYLPNGCYKLREASVEATGSNSFQVHQFAIKINSKLCMMSELPETLKMPVPYTSELQLGTLSKGEYTIQYTSDKGKQAFRTLTVETAPSANVDSLPYAAVSNVQTTEVLTTKQELKVELTGIYNNSCTEIDQVKVVKENDVFVLLPILKVRNGLCLQMLRPFSKSVKLGKQPSGHYLVHVRAMTGKAVNRIVDVHQDL